VARHGWAEVRAAWRSYLAQVDAEYASPQRFSATYGRWDGSVENPKPVGKPTVGDQNMAVMARFVKRHGGK